MRATQPPFRTYRLSQANHDGLLNSIRSRNLYNFRLKIIEEGHQRALIALSRADFTNYIKETNVSLYWR